VAFLLIGLGVVAAGIGMVVTGVRRKFLRQLRLARMSSRTRKIVETLGTVGNTARGIVAGVVGVLLVVAAAAFDPKKAQGLDGALRRIARTPLGSWLLVAVAGPAVRTIRNSSCCPGLDVAFVRCWTRTWATSLYGACMTPTGARPRCDAPTPFDTHWRRRRRIVQCGAWPAVASQPSRWDIAWAQVTTARTWSESLSARHRTDHG
jgi:hypothetical protein